MSFEKSQKKKNVKNSKRVQEFIPSSKELRIFSIFNKTLMFQLLRKLMLSIYHIKYKILLAIS